MLEGLRVTIHGISNTYKQSLLFGQSEYSISRATAGISSTTYGLYCISSTLAIPPNKKVTPHWSKRTCHYQPLRDWSYRPLPSVGTPPALQSKDFLGMEKGNWDETGYLGKLQKFLLSQLKCKMYQASKKVVCLSLTYITSKHYWESISEV